MLALIYTQTSRATTVEEVNGFLKEASETYLDGILGLAAGQVRGWTCCGENASLTFLLLLSTSLS